MKDKNGVDKKVHKDKWKRIFLFTVTAILIYFIIMTVANKVYVFTIIRITVQYQKYVI